MVKRNCGIYICIYDVILAIKKKNVLPFAAVWADFEGILLIEISQSKTYPMISLICRILETETKPQNQAYT